MTAEPASPNSARFRHIDTDMSLTADCVAFVDAIALRSTETAGTTELLLTVRLQHRARGSSWPSMDGEFHQVVVRFGGVRRIRIDDWPGLPHQTTGFAIVDVSANGLEDLNFEVFDYEHGSLGWVAQSVSVSAGWSLVWESP